jgi:hypothetical protein
MKDNNNWSTQGIKISCKHKRSQHAFTENSNETIATARYIQYRKTLRKLITKPKTQHYSRFTTKYNHKTKTTWSIIQKETRKVLSVEQIPTLLLNDKKLKDPSNDAKAFNNTTSIK